MHVEPTILCHICDYATSRNDSMNRHMRLWHKTTPTMGRLTENIGKNADPGPSPKPPPEATASASIEAILAQNDNRIRDYTRETKRLQDRYNFAVANPTVQKVGQLVLKIYRRQAYAFKLNVGVGFVLRNLITGSHEFFYASGNTRLFPKPITIVKLSDIHTFLDKFENQDLLEFCKQQRHNTRYVVERITNLLFYVNKLKPFPIGNGIVLPEFIKNRNCIIAMTKNQHGQPYEDNLCLFRCMAYHFVGRKKFEMTTYELAEYYCNSRGIPAAGYRGTTLRELKTIEDFFEINIEVWALTLRQEEEDEEDAENQKLMAIKRYWSRLRYEDTLYLNLYDGHFSYIKRLPTYTQFWGCKKCRKAFSHKSHCENHERHCLNLTTFTYPGGGYGRPKSIFDEMKEAGCPIPDNDQFFEYRIAYDFESYAEAMRIEDPDAKLRYIKKLIPASVSICSNVDGYQHPQCFISDGDPMNLMATMYKYIMEICGASYKLMTDKHARAVAFLSERLQELEQMNERLKELQDELQEIDDSSHAEMIDLEHKIYRHQKFKRMDKKFDEWLRQIPLIGFNAGAFDINLIRKYLFPYLLQNGIQLKRIIKKNNQYLSIKTDDLIILDVKNYLSPSTSYAQWLKSAGVTIRKGHWPYQWFESLNQLEETELVAKEHYWSDLKMRGISDEEYQYLQKVWKDEHFTCMADMLRWYNNLDTSPFIEALQKMYNYWKDLGIDAFKSGYISLPGLALALQMRKIQPHTILPVFNDETTFELVRSNIVGGLSVVTHRYHKAGVTALPNGQLVEMIYSHDCNALYLWALGEEVGTGIHAYWTPHSSEGTETLPWKRSDDPHLKMRWDDIKQSNDELLFSRKSAYPGLREQTEWLEYVSYKEGIQIDHKFNMREKIVKVTEDIHYPVDGFCADRNTIYQFHGCLWHGHGCTLDTEKDPLRRRSRQENTIKVERTLRELGFNIVTKRECAWLDEMRRNPEIKKFLESNLRLRIKTNRLTGTQILQKVKTGEFFGLLLVDVEIPFWDEPTIAKFDEFPPIYKNVEIDISQIGAHMRTFAAERGLMNKPRKCLINSFWGKKVLIATPLLRWYLTHGIEVTRIWEAIEMKAKRCFADFRAEITNHRRLGDLNPEYKPIGDMWKLVGNSAYGKTVTDKTRHKDTLVELDEKVSKHLNDRKFYKMEPVGDIAYEVSSDKDKINQDLPITIGFMVYNTSKAKMLEFIYDFLKKYLREGSFQIITSDTDSIVAAYADANIDNLVKEELKEEYFKEAKQKYLVTNDYDLREPGLFKIEAEALEAAALCSKTYFLWNEDGSKLSTKGLSKTTNNFTLKDFTDVLLTKQSGSGINRGLRPRNDEMYQYEQERIGLSYLYIKRKVLADGISTKALDA